MTIRKPRPTFDPTITEIAVCPGCATRLGGLITRDCPICAGTGIITLGARALYYDTPTTVALAITYALTATADLTLTITSDRDAQAIAIPAVLERLTSLGILERPNPCQTPPPRSHSPAPSPPTPLRRTRHPHTIPGQLTLFTDWPTHGATTQDAA